MNANGSLSNNLNQVSENRIFDYSQRHLSKYFLVCQGFLDSLTDSAILSYRINTTNVSANKYI